MYSANDKISKCVGRCIYLSTTEAYIMFLELSGSFASNFGLFNSRTLLSGGAVLTKTIFCELLCNGNERTRWMAS